MGIRSYSELQRIVRAQLEADHCLRSGSIEVAQANRGALLAAPRLDLDQMAAHHRRFSDHFELRLSNFQGLTLLCAQYGRVLDEVRALLGGDGGNWVGDYSKLRRVNDFLTPYALQNSGTALFFTPKRETVENPPNISLTDGYSLRKLSIHKLAEYKDSGNFSNALGFSEIRPDVLVLAAKHGDDVVAMAGASEDSDIMWQIGIDVLPEHRSKGLGTALVAQLTQEILAQGKVPFYGTSPSHIQSQTLAQRAGYEPAWFEFVSSSLLEASIS